MGFKRPILAAGMSIFMFSLAGIPPSAGFFAKFYAFRAAIDAGLIWLAIIGVLNSVVSVYYYLRVVLNMYMKEPDEKATGPEPLSRPVQAIICIGLFFILLLGIHPDQILNLADSSSLALK